MAIQKIIKVGNSYAVTIPKQFLKEINLQAGQQVNVITNLHLETMTIQPVGAHIPIRDLTPEFVAWLK